MKTLLTNQNLRNTKFYQLKQLQYFKQIIRRTQDLHLKQFLPLHVFKVVTKILDQQNFVYIPEKPIDQFPIGVAIDQNVTQISKKTTLYRVSKKLDKILRQVLILNIPVISNLNTLLRFSILNKSSIESYAFNRTIHRKGQKLRGIYFIIEGEVKTFPQKLGNSFKTIKQKNFIGLNELYDGSQCYYQTILSNYNHTQLLLIDLQTLNLTKIEDTESTLKQLINLYYGQQCEILKNIEKNGILNQRKSYQQKKVIKEPIRLNNFIKKCDQFMNVTSREDNGFNDYLKSKKILLQLRQTMSAAKLNKKNRKDRFSRNFMIQSIQKCTNINTNSTLCRSKILKEQILRRLSTFKNYTEGQMHKSFAESINIFPLPKDIR